MNLRTKFSWSNLVLGAIALVVSLGSSHPARADPTIHWQSDNRTPTQLSRELEAFYGGLVELLEQGQRVTTETF